MGKCIARSSYELGILIFLFFTKVLNVTSKSTTVNIINTMKSDSELRPLPQFVYENDIIKNCSSLSYPDKNITLINNPNTFLCLAFYDTWYKISNSNTFSLIPSDSTKFKSYIEKFFPEKGHETMFCENIKSVTFTYEKLKPLLSPIHFNKSNVCFSTCFDIKENFNPLCVILAWSKKIDEYVKSTSKPAQTQLQNLPTNIEVPQSKNPNSEFNKIAEKTIIKGGDLQQKIQSSVKSLLPNSPMLSQTNAKDRSLAKSESVSDKKNVLESSDKAPVKPQKAPEKSEKASEKSEKASENLDKASKNLDEVPKYPDKTPENLGKTLESSGKLPENANEAPESPNKAPESPDKAPENLDKASENSAKAFENLDNPSKQPNETPENLDKVRLIPDDTNNIEENKKYINDMKTNIISENTQDDNPVNQYDQNPAPDHHDTAADQNQNRAESTEPKDTISHYHSRSSDEESHFFTYFTLVFLISIAAYIGYHNKKKLLAIILEGRRSRNNRGRRRPSTANYRKLDCTLEEAVTSQCNSNVTHVIY